jgi:hypothetical protein
MHDFFHDIPLTADEAKILYLGLLCHDGRSLRPEWSADKQAELTAALDRLRAGFFDANDPDFQS